MRNFTGYFVSGDFPSRRLYACRFEKGRIGKPHPLNVTTTPVWQAVAAPSQEFVALEGKALYFSTWGKPNSGLTVRLFPDPNCLKLLVLSPGPKPLALWYGGLDKDNTHGLFVTDTDKGAILWQQNGAAYPFWDATGRHLVFARLRKPDGKGDKGYYDWCAYPKEFGQKGLGYARQHTDLFAADFGRGDSPSRARVAPISEGAAARLLGRWFSPYLRVCLREPALVYPDANTLFFAPGGHGVMAFLSWSPWDEQPSDPAFAAAVPPQIRPVRSKIIYFDATGRERRYDSLQTVSVLPRVFSRDGRFMYGDFKDREIYGSEGGLGEAHPDLGILDLHTGRRQVIKLPTLLDGLITVVEDEPTK